MTDMDSNDTDVDGIELTASEWTVNASETVSTGEYESFENFASVSGSLPDVDLDEAGREAVRRRLAFLQEDLRLLVQDGARSRLEDAPRRDEP